MDEIDLLLVHNDDKFKINWSIKDEIDLLLIHNADIFNKINFIYQGWDWSIGDSQCWYIKIYLFSLLLSEFKRDNVIKPWKFRK